MLRVVTILNAEMATIAKNPEENVLSDHIALPQDLSNFLF